MRIVFIIFLSVALIAQLAYLATDYDTLADWYVSLSPFYQQQEWTANFFTPQTKYIGNYYVGLGLLITLFLSIYILKTKSKRSNWRHFPFYHKKEGLPLLALQVLLTLFWILGSYNLPPAYDELFTTQRIASGDLFVAGSYYMLPNNHVGYSLLLGVLRRVFSFTGLDILWAGRIISLFAYLSIGGLLYFWLRRTIESDWLRVLAVLLASSQIGIWGFATQARGYLLLLLFSWVAFLALYAILKNEQKKDYYKWVFVFASSIGFFIIPVYLYIFAGLMAFWIVHQAINSKLNYSFFTTLGFTGALTFLLYLPTIAFSGLGALTGNKYVSQNLNSDPPNAIEFAAQWFSDSPNYSEYASSLWLPNHWLILVIFFLVCPIILIQLSKGRESMLPKIFLSVVIATIAITLIIKKGPAFRMLLWHYQAGFLIFWLCACRVVRTLNWKSLVIAIPSVLLVVANAVYIPSLFADSKLYYYPVKDTYKAMIKLVDQLPEGKLIKFSDEAFYPEYLFLKQGNNPELKEYQYFIYRDFEENLPEDIYGFRSVFQIQDYIILKR